MLRLRLPTSLTVLLGVVLVTTACGEPPHRPTGRFVVAWTFVSGRQCGTDEGLRVVYNPLGTDEPSVEDTFPCRDNMGEPRGRSTPIGLGSYMIEAELLLANGQPAPGIPLGTTNASVQVEGDEIPVDIAIPDRPASFDATVAIDFGAPGGLQCVGPGLGGLGAVRQDLRLIKTSDEECVEIVLGGQDHMGSIIESTTCNPGGLRCIERTATQRLEGIPPGRYRLEIDGSREDGGPVCWSGSLIFDTNDFRALENSLVDPVAGGALRAPATGDCP